MIKQATFLSELIARYQEAVKINEKYTEWNKDNPDKYPWHYKGEVVPKAKINRLGIMIRQEMIEYEKTGGCLY